MSQNAVLIGLLGTTVTASTPLLLAGLGELVCERAGNLNLGVEGMMLGGALAAFLVAAATGDPYLALVVGTFIGIVLASIHAYLTISLKANQVISGIMLTLLGTGLTTYLGNTALQRSVTGLPDVTLPVIGQYLVEIPILGPVLFRGSPIDFLAFASVPIVWYGLFRTRFGLELIAVGESAETADTMGISVERIRYIAVLFGGAMAGIGGAYLTLSLSNVWVAEMTAGRGWIAIALVIFARWRPWWTLVGAYLFGFISALAIRSDWVAEQVTASTGTFLDPIMYYVFNPSLMNTYPYIFTIMVLVYISARSRDEALGAPADLKIPYMREVE